MINPEIMATGTMPTTQTTNDHPTVVCLHSLFLSPTMFDQLKSDIGQRATVITPTFPGQADRLHEALATVTMDECVEDVLQILDRQKVGRFSIVAQSMGGDVAVRLAARHPSRVNRMVLMGASACAELPEQRAAFAGPADEMARNGIGSELAEFVIAMLFGASTLADPQQKPMLDNVRAHLGRMGPNFIHACKGVVERESVVDLLPQIHAPTLIVSGTEDWVRPPAWSDELFAGIPNCQLWRLKGMGHSPTLEAPAVINPRIIDFLGIA